MKWTSILKFIGTGWIAKKMVQEEYYDFIFNMKSSYKIKRNTAGQHRFFLYNHYTRRTEMLTPETDLMLVARVVYAEANPLSISNDMRCKIAVAEVIRNRYTFKCFIRQRYYYGQQYNNIREVIFETNAFQSVKSKKFNKYLYLVNNSPKELNDFLVSIKAAILALYNGTNYAEKATFFYGKEWLIKKCKPCDNVISGICKMNDNLDTLYSKYEGNITKVYTRINSLEDCGNQFYKIKNYGSNNYCTS